MERKSFLKALFTLVIAPSVIKDINWAIPKVQNTGCLFNDLNLLVPKYYEEYLRKYGSQNYELFIEQMGKPIEFPSTKTFTHYEQ